MIPSYAAPYAKHLTLVAPRRYVFISRIDLGHPTTLKPSNPSWAPDEPHFPRLCLAATLKGAIWGAGAYDPNFDSRTKKDRQRYWVYETEPIEAYHVSSDLIGDASLTTEHWSFVPVKATLLRHITTAQAQQLIR